MFFVATAAPEGRINLSPKGMDRLRVLAPDRLIWLNLTGSGNETAASGRVAAHDGDVVLLLHPALDPAAYGTARLTHHGGPGWDALYSHFPATPGARQVCDMTVDLVQTSCGYAVPLMDFEGPRDTLRQWAEKRGADGIAAYWSEKNPASLDGQPTGIEAALSPAP